MLKLTIYRAGETVEVSSNKLLGKDFPSNVVRDFTIELESHLTVDEDGESVYPTIRIRPYYRKKIGGVLNIFAEEEVEEGKI